MKTSSFFVRAAMLVAAFVHTFPATKHGRLFVAHPSIDEGWKALGALIAIAIYLLPPKTIARVVVALWRSHRRVVVAAGWLLACVHAVPMLDHLPRLFAAPTWGDGWRGVGSLFAVLWFVAPVDAQAALVTAARRLSNTLTPRGESGEAATTETS